MATKENNDKHICKRGDCCSDCCGCSCHHKSKYTLGRFVVLLVGVLLAFWVGYQLGMLKGLIIGDFKRGSGYHMKYRYQDQVIPVQVPVSTVTPDTGNIVPVQQ